MLLPNQEHLPRSDHESSGYESKASYLISTSNHNAMVDVKVHYEIASYLISTSNHNLELQRLGAVLIASYLISTSNHNKVVLIGLSGYIASYLISTSNHNWLRKNSVSASIASYLISTSNHNNDCQALLREVLLLISFLHQTTTSTGSRCVAENCFLSHFYIKPQPIVCCYESMVNCFLSHFYIKPQLRGCPFAWRQIASYLISTSNHNTALFDVMQGLIASYLISTSNHNSLSLFE